MATTENINAMISSYERIEGEYSFKNFLQSANIKKGTYACIGELLDRSYKAITVSLTKDQIKTLNSIRENNSNRVNFGCADPITEKITISGLEEIFGELCQQKDEKGKRLWLTTDGNLKNFWGDENKEQLDNYDQLSKYLTEVNGPRLSFNEISQDFTDEDVRKSISTFFCLIRHDQEVVDYIDELLSVIGNKGQISTKSVDKLLNSEKTPRFIAKSIVSIVRPAFFNKNDRIHYTYNEIRKISNQDNAKYADILNKVINSLLNEGSNRSHFWSNLQRFLNILRLLRNALGHYKKELVEEGEQLPVACFILHSCVGSFLAITKNLQNQGAILPDDERQKTLTIYYKQDLNKENFRDDKGGELSIEEEEEILKNLPKPRLFREEEIEPFDVSKGCAKYPIERNQHYTIRWGEGKIAVMADVPNEKFWQSASSNPVAIWNGVKYYFFSDLSTVYAELDPYVQNAQKKDVETLTGLVKSLNDIVSNLGSSTDANLEIVNGLKASVEKIQDKLNEINEGIKKGNKQNKIIIGLLIILCAIGLMGFFSYQTNRFSFFSSNDDPKTLIEKGDRYLKDGDAEKAGITYRKAIKAYEDILSNDSMDIDANIGLTMMLMRGKGDYNVVKAEQCAKRAADKGSSRGGGLYLYLLTRNAKWDQVGKYLRQDKYRFCANDHYYKLADAMAAIGESQNLSYDEVNSKLKIIQHDLPILEAYLDLARLSLQGIGKDSATDSYKIQPDPMVGGLYFNHIANDSICPIAMAMFSQFFYALGDIDNAFDAGYVAMKCGVEDIASFLNQIIVFDINFETSNDIAQKRYHEVFKVGARQTSVSAAYANFAAEYCKATSNKSMNSYRHLLKDLDNLITQVEKDNDKNYNGEMLKELYRLRVRLCLMNRNVERATRLAMEIDHYDDSIAVREYMQALSFHYGWGVIEDTIKSDSLINLSAERGYSEAIYTRLRKSQPYISYIMISEAGNLSAIEYYEPTMNLDHLNNLSKSGHALVEVTKDPNARMDTTIAAMAPSTVYIEDNIWKSSTKIAEGLSDYWYRYYKIVGKSLPYLPYCSEEYRIIYNVFISADIVKTEDGNLAYSFKYDGIETARGILNMIRRGLSLAMLKNNNRLAKHFVTLWLVIAKNNNITDDPAFSIYRQFALPEYLESGTFTPYYKIDAPIYAY